MDLHVVVLLLAALIQVLYFFDQTPWLLFFLLDILVWLLFEGGIYFAQSSQMYGYYLRVMSFQRNTVV